MKFIKSGLLALTLLVCAPDSSPAAEKSILEKVPATHVRAANTFYEYEGDAPDRMLAKNTLRVFVIMESNSFIEENRRWVADSGWRRGFKVLFDSVIRWKHDLLRKGPEHIWRLSQDYRHRPPAERESLSTIDLGAMPVSSTYGMI